MDTNPDSPEADLRQVQEAVLAKAPIAGMAKTRLIPALGPQGAARLQRSFTRHAVAVAQAASLGTVTLWCAPNAQHRFFQALVRTAGVACLVQTNGDLGQRMHMAFRLHCVQGPLLLTGTDCPPLRPAQAPTGALRRHGVEHTRGDGRDASTRTGPGLARARVRDLVGRGHAIGPDSLARIDICRLDCGGMKQLVLRGGGPAHVKELAGLAQQPLAGWDAHLVTPYRRDESRPLQAVATGRKGNPADLAPVADMALIQGFVQDTAQHAL